VPARLVADGEAAGCSPLAATTCGVALADGNFGAAGLAATAVSVDEFSHGFHHVQRGPDWQPTKPAAMLANIIVWTTVRFITLPSTKAGTKIVPAERRNSASLYDTSARPPGDIDRIVAREAAIGRRYAAAAGNCKRLRRLSVRGKGGL
jgi:hypothetical protein